MNNFNQELLNFVNWKTRICKICEIRDWEKEMKGIKYDTSDKYSDKYNEYYLCKKCFNKTKKIK